MSSVQAVLTNERRFWIETGHALAFLRSLPDACIHTAITSPPYFRQRDYGHPEQIGLEETPQEFIASLVAVFAEVRRVLRDDGTFWLNIGDGYAAGNKGGGGCFMETRRERGWAHREKSSGWRKPPAGWKPKDRLGMPHRLVFALQDDGFYFRDEVIWAKPAGMTESTEDRTTKAHELIFLLSKKPRYFFDWYTIADPSSWVPGSVSHPRSVWTLTPEFYGGNHFATFPSELPRRCILAGTSEKGCCPSCGAPWKRILEKERIPTRPGANSKCLAHSDGDKKTASKLGWNKPNVIGNRDPQRHVTMVHMRGWKPTCDCGREDTVPALVLDPFAGSGTTLLVANRLGRRAIGSELNPEYAEDARKRLASDSPLFNQTETRNA